MAYAVHPPISSSTGEILTFEGERLLIPKDWPKTTALVARWSFAFAFVYPHDGIAHHYLSFQILDKFPIGPLEETQHKRGIAAAFAILFLANAMKWPNVVFKWSDAHL